MEWALKWREVMGLVAMAIQDLVVYMGQWQWHLCQQWPLPQPQALGSCM